MEKNKSLIQYKDLEAIWRLVRKNFLLLLFIPLLTYAIGYIYAFRLPDVYGAKVELLLKSNETYDYQDPIYKGLGAYGMYMDVSNQTRILQSKDIIGEVVDKMNINVAYYFVERFKKKEVYGTLPFSANVELINENLYEVPISVEIVDINQYELSFEKNGQTVSERYYFDQELITEDFKLILTRNYTFHENNIDVLKASDYEIQFRSNSSLINDFQQKMTITNLEFTSILEVVVEDNIASRGKVFLDTLSEVFIEFSKETQLEVNQNTLENIEKQINEVQKIITNIENELIKYKDENDILHLSKEEDEYFSKYVDYSQKRRELQHNISSTESLESYILTSTDEHILAPSFYILEADPVLQERVSEMYQLQLDLVDRIYSHSPDHPTVGRFRTELGNMKKDLLIYIKNLKKAMNDQLLELNKLIASYKGDIQELPRAVQGVDNIKRELEVNNKMYLFLLEKKTNTLIARAGIIPQVQVIESPSSLGVIGPNKKQIKNLFLLGGVVLGLAVAFVRKVAFERIETVKELSDVSNLSILGGIPYTENVGDEIIVDKMPKSQITESFRTIRTNLSFYGDTDKAKIILVSSFLPSEGKTFCSTNLSKILANSDKKVLLIDFDLHKPKVHKTFKLSNDIGISSFISASAEIDGIIHKMDSKLSVITCGPIPPNPSELVLRNKVDELIEYGRANYDYVIVDTPPFGLLNDALSLIKFADVFVVVMNTKFARKRGVELVESLLAKHENVAKTLILNGIRESKFKYYYAKYSYKYGYNYGYGYGYTSTYGYGENYGEQRDSD